MDERLKAIFAGLPAGELAVVAAAVLGVGSVRVVSVEFSEISKPHADARTIGIVRVSGTAAAGAAGTAVRPWSCVTKLIDLAVPNPLGTPVDPRNEVRVYEERLFTGAGLRLRPARCHHISRPRDGLTILWLEDLTEASAPPFPVDELAEMAGHLGEWNAVIAAQPPALDFAIGQDFQLSSWRGFGFPKRLAALLDLADEPMVREMYARQKLQLAADYVEAYGRLVERSLLLPHALSLADCPISNFFHLPGETIAIDWAGLGSEPVGGDGGRFIGSAMSWGRRFVDVIADERDLFEGYLAGLRLGGSVVDRDTVRLGYLSEAAFYLGTITVFPAIVAGPQAGLSMAFFEKRFDMPAAAFASAMAPAIDLLPSYVAEMRRLLA
ncbi:MAG: hypothetical protein EOP22_05260 [Hyphomicrobiales bacterium]|nr:MAG: hypothetical protein EOP22_05260 [Hyphomicrobiales bacterium]